MNKQELETKIKLIKQEMENNKDKYFALAELKKKLAMLEGKLRRMK